MSSVVYDVVVVGAGIEGSATAYTAAKRGKRVLLLEQFMLPHSRGSSHGATRITRKSYDYEVYVKMMIEAYPLWNQLERETSTQLYRETGLMVLDHQPYTFIEKSIATFKKYGLPYREFSSQELHSEYPMLRVPSTFKGCLDTSGGTLKADKALGCYQTMFKQLGGVLHDNETVTDITPGDIVTVKTSNNTYRTRSLILTPGAWAKPLLGKLQINLPLTVAGINVCYWQVKPGQTGFPHTFILDEVVPWSNIDNGTVTDVYGLPEDEYNNCVKVETINVCYWRIKQDQEGFPHCLKMVNFVQHSDTRNGDQTGVYGLCEDEYSKCVKLCLHSGYKTDPDRRDADRQTGDIEELKKVISSHFPTLEENPSIVERCMYTMTPDHNPIMDRHPKWKNIVIGAGFSGHGFKLAPAVGKVLTELALNERPSFDLTIFKADRFTPKSSL